MSDIGSDLMGEVYRFEVKRRGTRAQQIAPRYTQELHFNAESVELFYNLSPPTLKELKPKNYLSIFLWYLQLLCIAFKRLKGRMFILTLLTY